MRYSSAVLILNARKIIIESVEISRDEQDSP